jgi:uncharacterized protein (TIGR02391 family)
MKYNGFIFRIKIIQPSFNKLYKKYEKMFGDKQKENSKKEIVNEQLNFYGIHPEIKSKCSILFKPGTYAEAVEKSFKIVKDRLRKLTSYERGSDAFGNGGLHIKGAVAQNVDKDFNQGVKFLTMAIDMFKNEKGHTSDGKIEDPIRAYQYLIISSLALYFLDDSEIIKK